MSMPDATAQSRTAISGSISLSVARSAWRDLPIWFLAYQGYSTFHLELKSLDPPRPEFGWTVVFPLLWVVAYLWWCRGPTTRTRLVRIAVWSLAPLALLALLPVNPMSNAEIHPWFEASTLACVALLALHCALTRPAGDFGLFYGVGLLYAFILENGGIWMGFFSEPGYMIHFAGFPGPLATALGWTTVFYTSMHVAEELRRAGGRHGIVMVEPAEDKGRQSAAGLALTATLVALSLDLQLDPAATAAQWWIWHPSLRPGFLGVPLVNYTAWLAAMAPFFWLVAWVRRHSRTRARANITLLVSLPPLVAGELMLVMLLTALVEGGWTSPSLVIFAETLGPPLRVALLALGVAFLAVLAVWQMGRLRRARALRISEIMRLALSARLIQACGQRVAKDERLRAAMGKALGSSLDPIQTYDEIMGQCLERGWIEGPPEARRVTEDGRRFVDEFREVVDL
jgi:uncharacterized membrane protein